MRHSEVVFMYPPADLGLYDAYHATVVLWGSAAGAAAAQGRDVRHQSSIWFLTAWGDQLAASPDLLASVCVDIEGKPIEVPWLTDFRQKLPNYWGCTNAPAYRAYLHAQALKAVHGAPAGLHIDDHCGTAACAAYMGGCFCRHCMAAFRDYLRAHYSVPQLVRLGVDDPGTFDYAAYARRFGATRKAYLEARHRMPLYLVFMTFQARAESELVREIRAACEQAERRQLTFSANCGLPSPLHLADYAHLDTLCGEIDLNASRARPSPVAHLAYRVADAVQRPLASTAGGGDWAWIAEHNRPGLVHTWIAESYAFGHRLMAPHHQWAHTPERGTHWWDCRTVDMAPWYRFVAEHRDLFDGFEPVSDTVLVLNTRAAFGGNAQASEAAACLARNNVQYRVALAGADWIDARITASSLRNARLVMSTQAPMPDARQTATLEAVRKSGRLLEWSGAEPAADALPKSVVVTGSASVWALVRRSASTGEVVVHLLNRDYDAATDTVRPSGPVTVTIDGALIGKRRFRAATAWRAPFDAMPVQITSTRERTTLEVGPVGAWTIVRVQP